MVLKPWMNKGLIHRSMARTESALLLLNRGLIIGLSLLPNTLE